jgi:8-oxo-dGTP pyrophosphatase MutT (NUDIX family)
MQERWRPSVTVAAVIARSAGEATEYLLVEEHTPEGLRLNNPAGHLERGESLEQAVVREALEETGCDFVPEAVLGVYLARFERPAQGEDVTYLRVAFAGRVGAPRPGHRLDDGIVRAAPQRHPAPQPAGAALRRGPRCRRAPPGVGAVQ